MAEALLYSDKLNESIDHLNLNTRIDSESDLLFSSCQNDSVYQKNENSNEKLSQKSKHFN